MPTKEKEHPRVFLDNVRLKGFKSIEDLSINFQRGLNILIGKNGAGKSNFLELLNLAIGRKENSKVPFTSTKLGFISNDNHTFVIETKRERGVHKKQSLQSLVEHPLLSERLLIDGKVIIKDSRTYERKNPIEFKDKKIRYRGNSVNLFGRMGYGSVYSTYLKYNLPTELGFIDFPGTVKIENTYFEWLFPKTLDFLTHLFWEIESFYEDDDHNIEDINGEAFLNHLKIQDNVLENLKRYTTIEDVKFNLNINFYKDDKSTIIENIKLDFKVNGNWLPWSQLSDGTKRLFYIVSEVTYNTGLILIEEPELGVHPHQFHLLMGFLKEQSEHKQIILSTHAPKALDHLSIRELENVLITYYDANKGTQIKHLTNKEKEKARMYMKEVGFFSDYWMHSDLE